LYHIATKEVDGVSRDILLKWNRMGQDIPGETEVEDLGGAAFNSPFEEFSLVLELRNTCHESPGEIYTQKPLAIYVPRRFVEAERLGRRPYKIRAIQRRHDEIFLDSNRNYAVIYEWIKGIDASEAWRRGLVHRDTVRQLVERSNQELESKGFCVRDNKPSHMIVRPTDNGWLRKDRSGEILYALVDYELLQRSPEREEARRTSKRRSYLVRQAHRFEAKELFPPDLVPTTIMDVAYVFGEVESTGGALWVVGKDPLLFDYFLPEKWRGTPRTKLSVSHQVYHTITKDNVNLVWRVSRVGERPDTGPGVERGEPILSHGYNSPFEEVSMSLELARRGIETTYPRAIYMTGHRSKIPSSLTDMGRYESHAPLTMSDGHPILSRHHDYIIIWGYWNGPDGALAVKDEVVYRGIDAVAARRAGRISEAAYLHVMKSTREKLATAGVEDLNPQGNHLLLSLDISDRIATDRDGEPLVRVCNFELLRRVGSRGK
jgi:hypothetical protein